MNILVEVAEATVRLEELIALAIRGDEIVICRDKRPIALLAPITQDADAYDNFLALLAEGRKSVPAGTNSDHWIFMTKTGCRNECRWPPC